MKKRGLQSDAVAMLAFWGLFGFLVGTMLWGLYYTDTIGVIFGD